MVGSYFCGWFFLLTHLVALLNSLRCPLKGPPSPPCSLLSLHTTLSNNLPHFLFPRLCSRSRGWRGHLTAPPLSRRGRVTSGWPGSWAPWVPPAPTGKMSPPPGHWPPMYMSLSCSGTATLSRMTSAMTSTSRRQVTGAWWLVSTASCFLMAASRPWPTAWPPTLASWWV